MHKQMGDIIYSDLLHAMVRVNKLQVLVDKLEVQLKHEKVENKANSIQIKNLQADIISSGSEIGNPGNQKTSRRKRQRPRGTEEEIENLEYRTCPVIRIIGITRGEGQGSSGYDGV